MKNLTPKQITALAVALAAVVTLNPEPAAANGLATWVQDLKEQFDAGMTAIGLIVSVAGFATAAACFFKLKEHNNNPAQVPLSQPLMLAVIAAGLIGLPEFLGIGVGSLFGGGGDLANSPSLGIDTIKAK